MKLLKIKLFIILMLGYLILGASVITYAVSFGASFNYPDSDTEVLLSWSTVADSVFYDVYRDNVSIASININKDLNYLRYIDKGLIPQKDYTYTLYCLDASGSLLDSSTSQIRTSEMIKPKISKAIYSISTGNIKIYLSQYSKAASTISVYKNEVAMTVSNSTNSNCTFKDTTIIPGQTYQYRVKTNGAQEKTSSFSDYVTVVPIDIPRIFATTKDNKAVISVAGDIKLSNYIIERSKYSGIKWEDWQTIDLSINPNANIVENILPQGYSFRYRLKINNSLYEGYSNISNPVALPIAPTNLKCSYVDLDKIDLSWQNDEKVQSLLRIERKKSNEEYQTIANIDRGISSYSDTQTLEIGYTYYYRIVAYGVDETAKSYSNEISISTGVPSSPTNLEMQIISKNEIMLKWKDNANNESGYLVERKTDEKSDEYELLAGNLSANSYQYLDKTLDSLVTYCYRVRAFNYSGNSYDYSNEVCGSTLDFVERPNSLVCKTVSQTQIDISWTFANNSLYEVVLERKEVTIDEDQTENTDGEWIEVSKLPISSNNYSDTQLKLNTKYYYRIKSLISENIFSQTYPDDIGVEAKTFLNNPMNLLASYISSTQIKLTWEKPTGGTKFVIERKSESDNFEIIGTASSNLTSWTDQSVEKNQLYIYRIKSENASNNSGYSNEAQATIFTVEPPEEVVLKFIGRNKIEITWKDVSVGETGYKIKRYIQDDNIEKDQEWVEINYLLPNSDHFLDENNISPDKTYYYKVITVNTMQDIEEESEEASIFMQEIQKPSNFVLTSQAPCQSYLKWTDNSDNEDGFVLERALGDGDFLEIARTKENEIEFIDYDLFPSTKYRYRLVGFNEWGISDYSDIKTIMTENEIKLEDVTISHNSYNAIRYMINNGLMTKWKTTSMFKPKMKITRGELISLLVNCFKLKQKKSKVINFEDINPEHKYYKEIMIARSQGIISGSGDNKFNANRRISLQDMAVIMDKINRILKGSSKVDLTVLTKYKDATDISKYAIASMSIMIKQGIIQTINKTNLYPLTKLNRGDAASTIYNLLKMHVY